ncbi:MAG: NAD(P)-dependent oxidoreductase, partial [Anaerolineaceae bacterium]|nr:NAD(P)-dependent oxidoreductase [Anaerolineaceae bacterium]
VLVTGSSGRLAPFVIDDLVAHGHEVVLFSRKPVSEKYAGLPLILGDINNPADCEKAMAGGIEAVQHLAAQPYPVDHPELRKSAAEQGIPFDATMRSNIMGLYYLLQAAHDHKVETFVMTGSNCALGHGFRISHTPFPFQYLPIDEEHPSDVEDSYSYTKLAGEELLASFTRAYAMRTYSVRAAGICDEARRRSIAQNARGAAGWNDWLWAWVGSEDVASAHRLLMEKARFIQPHGVFYCNGDDTTALEPSRTLVESFRPDLLPLTRVLPGNASFLSNQKLKQVVGWQHATSWRIYLDGGAQ